MNGLELNRTMSSREIAQLTGKEHRNVIRDCDLLNENYTKLGLLKIEQGHYTHPNTGNQQHREYLLTKIQTLDLMTGYRVDLRIKVNRRWEELEKKEQHKQQSLDFSDPNTVLKLAQSWKDEQDKRMLAEEKLQAQAPQVRFAQAVETSTQSVLVAQLAKIITQGGYEIGQNRLFKWMRLNGFLGSVGDHYNLPTQRAMIMGLFELKKTTITKPDGTVLVSTTPKVTGKGQVYFVNRFLNQQEHYSHERLSKAY